MTVSLENPVTASHRESIRTLYDAYFDTLDEGRLEEWPEFFADDCRYRIITRENYEAEQGLCIMQADSKGMLTDRVRAILKTQVYAPRYYRRFYTGLRIVGGTAKEWEEWEVRQNVLIVQTLIDKPSEILGCGTGHDRVVSSASGELKFVDRTLILDTEMIRNSLIYPA
jgi:3-phenylpropionate/cinnamic acid dioxygenase small subunit